MPTRQSAAVSSAAVPTRAWQDPPQPAAGLLAGLFRQHPEAFQVDEQLGWQPSEQGPHLLVRVCKQSANTAWVAGELARRAGCGGRDVGYCGSKDRHALTWQWFSIPDERDRLDPATWSGEGWAVVAHGRHQRKLRRGDHCGNRFRLQLELAAEPAAGAAEACLRRLAEGVPNYFGPQRFGRGGANLEAAADWVRSGRLTRDRRQRGWLLSAARALLFNQVLRARVLDGSWRHALAGEAELAGEPSGPMWGRGRSAAGGDALLREQAALEPWQAWCARLEHVGLQQERRPLILRPQDCELEIAGRSGELAFTLPAGAYATAVLHALGEFHEPAAPGLV